MKLFFHVASLFLCTVVASQAAILMTLEQVGDNVVLSVSGYADVSALEYEDVSPGIAAFDGSFAALQTGVFSNMNDHYTGITGPTAFGNAMLLLGNWAGGDSVGVLGGFNTLYLPVEYVSGSTLSGSSVFLNTTLIGGFGLSAGDTFTWLWGEGGAGEMLTISVVPEPSMYAMFAGLLTLVLAITMRRKRG